MLLWIALWATLAFLIVGIAFLIMLGDALRFGRGGPVTFAETAKFILKPGLLTGIRAPWPVIGLSWLAWTILGAGVIMATSSLWR